MQVANSALRVLTPHCLDQSPRGIPFTRRRPTCQFWGHNREWPRAWQICTSQLIKAPCSNNNRVSKMIVAHHWRTVTMMCCSQLLLIILVPGTQFPHTPSQICQSTRQIAAGTGACDRARWTWVLTAKRQLIKTWQPLFHLPQALCKRHWSVLPPQVS